MLFLSPPPTDWEGKPAIVVSKWSGPLQINVEQAGRAHLEKCVKLFSTPQTSKPKSDRKQHVDAEMDEEEGGFVCSVSTVADAELDDYYSLLGISHLSLRASIDEIKKAYRKVSLLYHPDKNILEDNDRSEELFKAIGEAYTCLTDLRKRRSYDSTVPFNDDIPDADARFESFQDFCDAYGPVFERNLAFSEKNCRFTLGDESTPIEKVNKFYDFWFSFKSWREFPVEDEYELNEDSTRDEKRWVARQNAKLMAASKKAESQRIRQLTERAINCDTRIVNFKRQQKEAREAKKREKDEIKRKETELKEKEEEEKRLLEEALLEKEKSEKVKKKNAHLIAKKKLKNARRCLRSFTEDSSFSVSVFFSVSYY